MTETKRQAIPKLDQLYLLDDLNVVEVTLTRSPAVGTLAHFQLIKSHQADIKPEPEPAPVAIAPEERLELDELAQLVEAALAKAEPLACPRMEALFADRVVYVVGIDRWARSLSVDGDQLVLGEREHVRRADVTANLAKALVRPSWAERVDYCPLRGYRVVSAAR